VSALLALAVATLLLIVGVLVARAFADAKAGAVIAGFALPFAFAGGLLLGAPKGTTLPHLGAPNLLLGSAALLVAAIVGYLGAGAVHRIFMAGIVAAVAGGIAAALCLAGVPSSGGAAVVLTMAAGLLPGYPLLATWLGKLPVPRLPDRAEDILADRPMPERSAVFAAVSRAAELLAGMLTGAAVVSLAATVVLVRADTTTGRLLGLAGAATLLLRARLFPAYTQRIPLLVGGVGGLAVLVVGTSVAASSAQSRLLILLGVLIVAATVLLAGLAYSRERPSPYVGRVGDIVDVLVIMALIPLACAATGLFQAIQGVFASIGG
jgi:type VII secretion integral membrane protein EccD